MNPHNCQADSAHRRFALQPSHPFGIDKLREKGRHQYSKFARLDGFQADGQEAVIFQRPDLVPINFAVSVTSWLA
jgi:hypothetical protein